MKPYKANGRYNLAAEWQFDCIVLIAWPDSHTDWDYMLPEAQAQARSLILAMLQANQPVLLLHTPHSIPPLQHPLLTTAAVSYNDTWTRDYGPLTVAGVNGIRLLDFGFNAWGLKFAADADNLTTLQLCRNGVYNETIVRNCREFILEGGAVETDGNGTLLTTSRCLCSPNRNGGLSKEELNQKLHQYLGVDHVLWLDYGALQGDDTDSHIDTLARMAPNQTILYTGCTNHNDSHYSQLQAMYQQLRAFRTAQGNPFNLVQLPLPDPICDEQGERLPATYANYLVTRTHLFIPTYNQPLKDRLAVQTINSVFPHHIPVPVDCRKYLHQHGSLHCATMQLPLDAIRI